MVEALRDEVNEANDDSYSPSLPHQLLAMKPRDIGLLVLKYQDRLASTWTQSKIDMIVEQHKQLQNIVNRDKRLKHALSRHSEGTDFSEAWTTPGLKDKFPELIEFLGGLACPFPNTATVESDSLS